MQEVGIPILTLTELLMHLRPSNSCGRTIAMVPSSQCSTARQTYLRTWRCLTDNLYVCMECEDCNGCNASSYTGNPPRTVQNTLDTVALESEVWSCVCPHELEGTGIQNKNVRSSCKMLWEFKELFIIGSILSQIESETVRGSQGSICYLTIPTNKLLPSGVSTHMLCSKHHISWC